MRQLVDHATHFRRIDQLALLVHLVEPETDKGRTLHFVTTDRRADLLDDNGFLLSHDYLLISAIKLRPQTRRGEPEVPKP